MSTDFFPPRNETLYGSRKRHAFFLKKIRERAGSAGVQVVELGSGTGEALLLPLAESLGPSAKLVGMDSHAPSIAYGEKLRRDRGMDHLRFVAAPAEDALTRLPADAFDVAITSEVLEHVTDPRPLLNAANALLKPGGLLLVTIPNGYGPFEWEKFFWSALSIGTLIDRLRGRRSADAPTDTSTLNKDNTHVAFYRKNEVKELLRGAGFRVREFHNREWFCGPFSDLAHGVLKRVGLGWALVAVSQAMGRVLPAFCASDWMIVAEKVEAADPNCAFPHPSGPFSRWWWRVKRRQAEAS